MSDEQRGNFPSDKQEKFSVRFPDGMRDQVRAEAERSGRSMNQEIIARLADSLSGQSQTQTLGGMSQTQVQQSRDAPQFPVRIPADLKRQIEGAAKANGRSMNTEIVAALLKNFDASQFQLQLPEELKAQIEREAKANLRSINSEIVAALMAHFCTNKG